MIPRDSEDGGKGRVVLPGALSLLDTTLLIYAGDRSYPSQVMGWPLATADPDRFRTYLPAVHLETP